MILFEVGHYYLFYGHGNNNSYRDLGTDIDRAMESALSSYLFITRNDFCSDSLNWWILFVSENGDISIEDITGMLHSKYSGEDPEINLDLDFRGF